MDWNATVEELAPALFRYFSAAVPSHQADDLVQEVFLRLVRKFDRFDPAKGSLKMYAFGIAHFVRLEAFHQKSTASMTEEGGSNLPASMESDRRDEVMDLKRAIAKLPENERQVVLLQIDNDLSMDKIAEILQIPIGTVKSHLHRAKDRLKAILQKETKYG